ncbi:hypothetical protein OC834_002677 [Tilletia horrida]|uniref:Uncharacterized protein n=1 Tax=Tilletia horrida TaxID=155126 RepID=A0AAN6JNF9_9BASI|nr:hypothetical protein OC835_006542 [Tilletia horrida]KAK0532248.1 hypothetical protein OC834_002677 [Tilletia horrida]KAK0541227.1 hypothetical protein OC842_000060 [Tilletia horrida]
MNNQLSSPFVFQAQQHAKNAPSVAAAFGAMSNTNALSSATTMAIHIPQPQTRKRKSFHESDEDHAGNDHAMDTGSVSQQHDMRPLPSRKLSTPRSAIGNPALAQWVELDPAENQSTLASLGLLPSANQGNVNLFAQQTPASAAGDYHFSAGASTSAGTPAMTGSPSSLFSEIPGMPPTPSDSHSMLPATSLHRGSASNLHRSYFDNPSHKNRTMSSSSHARPCGILEPQLGLSGADVAMDGTSAQQPSTHGPWCKSIPQLSVRADGSGSELWALCRDCGTLDKVNPAAFSYKEMAYSP